MTEAPRPRPRTPRPPAQVENTECLELPYSNTDEDLWRQTAVVSWRWGAGKPAALTASFSPMTEPQFRELAAHLRYAKEEYGFKYVWIGKQRFWC